MLTILCVSRFGAHAAPFIGLLNRAARALGAELVIGADGDPPGYMPENARIVRLQSAGYIESVLDEAITACPEGYVLRLDDDERISQAMFDWLAAESYLEAEHWAFPRMHLWPDRGHYITSAPLWPDLQTRLSLKGLSGQRHRIHAGSPFGTGRLSDVAIEHHKFLVRPRAEREALLEHYEALQAGAGGELFDAFSVPELYAEHWQTMPVGR